MDTDLLRIFAEVAHAGSFAAVARQRNVDPSSISRQLAELERAVGARLLQRTTRSLALTEAGDAYLRRIEPLLDELDHARDLALQGAAAPSGTLRLTASVAFGQLRIVPLLGEFRLSYPGVQLDCLFTDENVDLIAQRVDLAIRKAAAVEGDLVATKLVDTRYRIVASPDYLAAAAPIAQPDDLLAHRCLLFPYPGFRSQWRFRDAAGHEVTVPVTGDLMLSTGLALRDAALAGLGPALLPDWVVDEQIAAGRLLPLLGEYRVTGTEFDTAAWLVYPSRRYLPAKVRVMIDFLKAHLSGA
ncbi:transcriptional regulator, LysR family [Andreprevotia lacus DSM 23236]|jgi:DNA-binding transcriptional LysR family regulator|uniref:Transcriptional regulator, LysR family n=1 Tax=Andreprevotia lacus DSM 23236 TaxID=1121001 RepID=A0A1W1Y0J5_9NEIS|nr:LysR family transcriptional regulator [Andreprevotia lacus]SMC29683.1 transcriptional regulator, LysR family [Andreprevotia lacus DSM 23236]